MVMTRYELLSKRNARLKRGDRVKFKNLFGPYEYLNGKIGEVVSYNKIFNRELPYCVKVSPYNELQFKKSELILIDKI
jgi:hypothetical protein